MRTLLALILTLPTAALACGGLFCNASRPVEQAAERILFVVDDATIHMHVRLTYVGPPADFGWLLPVPPGVETGLSSEALFAGLDSLYTPRFWLDYEYEDDCVDDTEFAGAGGAGGGGGGGGQGGAGGGAAAPPVQVLSREAVGPYDRVILAAEDVGALREWLDENEFAIPPETDERLVPYIDAGAHFVAIRLLADAESRDVVPLRLSFPGDRPGIPIVPTAVAATPDMGIIVHVLGAERAVPVNYLHVEINEAAVAWERGGSNYPDVVAQAADEAGGKAFATDYAGTVDPALTDALTPLPDRFLDRVAGIEDMEGLVDLDWPTRGDPDLVRVFAGEVGVPEGEDPRFFFSCMRCYEFENDPVDGAAIADRLRTEVQPPREHLTEQFAAHRYLTRLFSAMSPAEMDLDPVFSFNPDLDGVEATREAVLWIPCNPPADGEDRGVGHNWDAREVRLSDGRVFSPETEPIERQGGQLFRGTVPAARRIDQLTEAGQPGTVMVIDPGLPGGVDHIPPTRGGTVGGDASCGCAVNRSGGAPWLLLALLLWARRRRIRRGA